MKIALCIYDCDTLLKIDNYTRKYINSTTFKYSVDRYKFGMDLIEVRIPYDLIVIDCELPDINGIELARKIRSYDEKTTIIFIANDGKYVYESFEVSAFRYLLKPINPDSFHNSLHSFIEKYEKCGNLLITINRSPVSINYNDIVYIESSGNHSFIMTLNGCLDVSYTISHIQSQIKSFCFFRTHRRFIVNMRHIQDINGNTIYLTNCHRCLVSRNSLQCFNKTYMNFLKYIPKN